MIFKFFTTLRSENTDFTFKKSEILFFYNKLKLKKKKKKTTALPRNLCKERCVYFKRIGAVDFELESSPTLKKLSARKTRLKVEWAAFGRAIIVHILIVHNFIVYFIEIEIRNLKSKLKIKIDNWN